ncbi:MAG: glycoside hydrolase family 25 protein [Parerythrobacter sp.]
MGRTANPRRAWLWRIAAALLLAALLAGGWLWWDMQHWTPPESEYPDQGVLVSGNSGPVQFAALAAQGAGFAYIETSGGDARRNTAFTAQRKQAILAGLQVGAVHRFDPCRPADSQSANFVTSVPRSADMLPPALSLEMTTDSCEGDDVSDAMVQSELMTLANQMEIHAERPVILKIAPEFDRRYPFAARIERSLWVTRTRLAPTYAGRPWLLWTANEALATDAAEAPVGWVVVQP